MRGIDELTVSENVAEETGKLDPVAEMLEMVKEIYKNIVPGDTTVEDDIDSEIDDKEDEDKKDDENGKEDEE